METFADYILSEQDLAKKMEIVYHLNKQTGIYYNSSVILKTELARMFMDSVDTNLDPNLVLTATLLCGCKKSDKPQDLSKVKSYAKESGEYLKTLGFSDRFCKICEEQNRYSGSEPRERESDILELVDNFGGMLMHRPERKAFTIEEATNLLVNRNFKDKDNRYLDEFVKFIEMMEQVKVSEKNVIDDSISYIAHLGKVANETGDIKDCINKFIQSRSLLSAAKENRSDEMQVENNVIPEELAEEIKKRMDDGDRVSSAVIHDDGYVVNTDSSTITLHHNSQKDKSLSDKKAEKIKLTETYKKARKLDEQYKKLFGENERNGVA